mmetsp:Transcript_12630/g.26593  ORF Transcript_12630/g.26593 Transcript_12630/m.26593 type:complete len:255 (-) Transcript_12630:1368-2132(-)
MHAVRFCFLVSLRLFVPLIFWSRSDTGTGIKDNLGRLVGQSVRFLPGFGFRVDPNHVLRPAWSDETPAACVGFHGGLQEWLDRFGLEADALVGVAFDHAPILDPDLEHATGQVPVEIVVPISQRPAAEGPQQIIHQEHVREGIPHGGIDQSVELDEKRIVVLLQAKIGKAPVCFAKDDRPVAVGLEVDPHVEVLDGGVVQVLDAGFGDFHGDLEHVSNVLRRCPVGVGGLDDPHLDLGQWLFASTSTSPRNNRM